MGQKQSFGGLGWVELKKLDLRTTLGWVGLGWIYTTQIQPNLM